MLHVVDIGEPIHTEHVAFCAFLIDLIQGFSGSSASCSVLAGSRGQRVHWCPTDTQDGHHQYHTLLHGGAVVVHPDTATTSKGCMQAYIHIQQPLPRSVHRAISPQSPVLLSIKTTATLHLLLSLASKVTDDQMINEHDLLQHALKLF